MSRTFRRKSSTPDISLPSVPNKNWKNISRILCIDESLNDSGAALFVDGTYQPVFDDGVDVGLAMTLSPSMARISKIVAYDRWLRQIIDDTNPDIVVLESHPFMRGNATTSVATLEVLVGVRYIAMLACANKSASYAEFSTNDVKTIMCGSSSATKDAVQLVLSGCGYVLPKYKGKNVVNSNVCDAIAMGEVLCRMQKQEVLRQEYLDTTGEGRSQTSSRTKRIIKSKGDNR